MVPVGLVSRYWTLSVEYDYFPNDLLVLLTFS
jgi:hypothetical protein